MPIEMSDKLQTHYYTERVHKKACDYILSLKSRDFFDLFPSRKNKSKESFDDMFFGKAYYNYVRLACTNYKNNSYQVNVAYTTRGDNVNKSRLYSIGKSIQGLCSEIRKILTTGVYNDFDIVNCHPSIMLHLCKKHKLKCASLSAYVEKRDAFLIENDVSKQQMLVLMNKDHPALTSYTYDVKELIVEMKDSKKKLFEIYSEEYGFKKKKNPISSCVSRVLCKYENDLLQAAIKKIDKSKIGVLMYDGFMTEEKIDVSLLNCDIVKWAEKPNISTFDIPDIPKNNFLETKTEFEDEHGYFATKILDPPCFVLRLKGKITIYTEQQLSTAFRHMKYTNNEGDASSFIGLWLSCEDIQLKSTFGNYPFQENCPADEYNVWEEFVCKTWTRDGYERDEAAVKLFTDHLKSLCNFEENVYDFMLKWVAHIFQKTDIKPGVCPIMCGKQGTGKDLFLDIVSKMMGDKKRFESVQPEIDVYGEFNPLLMGALVIQLSEIDKRNTMTHLGKIKSLITAPTIKINDKGKTHVTIQSFHRPLVLSNNPDPITGEKDQRRFIHFYGSSVHIGDGDYFKKLVGIMSDKNALLSIYDFLLEVQDVPDTFTNIKQYFSKYQCELEENNEPYEYQFMKNYVHAQNMRGVDICKLRSAELFVLFQMFIDHQSIRCDISATRFGTKITAMMVNTSIEKIKSCGNKIYKIDIQKLMKELSIDENMEVLNIF